MDQIFPEELIFTTTGMNFEHCSLCFIYFSDSVHHLLKKFFNFLAEILWPFFSKLWHLTWYDSNSLQAWIEMVATLEVPLFIT